MQIRQDFTKSTINTLQTGSDALTLADSNQEGANLLALQTRQQLSTTALSLASQADQAVLRCSRAKRFGKIETNGGLRAAVFLRGKEVRLGLRVIFKHRRIGEGRAIITGCICPIQELPHIPHSGMLLSYD